MTTLWKLPDARLGDSKGKNEIPEVAVVHEDMFRSVALATSAKYPVSTPEPA